MNSPWPSLLLCTALACGTQSSAAGELDDGSGEEAGDDTNATEASESATGSGSESESGTDQTSGPSPDLGAPDPHCCGCLCVDSTWSCSDDNCQDEDGHALALEAEAGFFEISGGEYVVNAQPNQSGHARVWYSFVPALETPESKPLIVLFNGGPGSATASLLVYNLGPWTMDEALTGGEGLEATQQPWTEFANLLFIDAPNTGFSYTRALDGGVRPSVGIDRQHDAGVVLRALLAFLRHHPQLAESEVILTGESYAGVRVQLMLEYLFDPTGLTQGDFQDPQLAADVEGYLAEAFAPLSPEELTPEIVATRFSRQILIQALVAGFEQMNLVVPSQPPGCVSGGDLYQCDEADGYTFARIHHAAAGLARLDTLTQVLGVDPTTIAWLRADERLEAYGRTMISNAEELAVDLSELESTLGVLNEDDRYYVAFNYEVFSTKEGADHPWDSAVGESFARNALYTRVFMTNAALDLAIWGPNLPLALEAYPTWFDAVVHDTAPRPGVERPGWIQLDYAFAVVAPGDSGSREIRFPTYANSGHMVNLRQPEGLAADVAAWLAQ